MSKGGRLSLSRLFPRLFKADSKKKAGNAGGDTKGPSCSIIFLDDSEHMFTYKSSWKAQTLFDQVCDLIDLSEKVYFGLRFVDATGQAHWLDVGKSVSSQLKGCSASQPKLYFGVKFYTADPCKLREEITRYLFFLQVKRDILQGRLPVSFEDAAELCAYAVQSEMGDFDSRVHTPGYVSEFSFLPNQTEELEAKIAGMHRRCQGATPVMAEHKFLEKVKWLEMYGVDLHPVQDTSNVDFFLGLTPTAIVVYKHRTKIASHFWPRITKASHKGKVFAIKVKDKNNDEHVYAFELSTKSACKHLWKCSVEHRTFFSERSERLTAYESRSRNEPSVHRAPSRRKQRRVNSDSRLNTEQLYQDQYANYSRGVVTMIGQPEQARGPRHKSLPELHGRQSPRSVKSAPWESRNDHGLYTSGHDTPTSGRQTSFVSVGSDSESGISQRKRYFPSRKGSDNESDASVTRRRRRELDSESGSEVSFSNSGHNRKNLFGHRNLKASDPHIAHSYRDKGNSSHGSIPSIHSAPAGEVRQRRRRRRSKSPGNSKQPPEELKQHIEFDLVDTEGMTDDQLRDIQYTKVETKANLFRIKYSPKFRHKIWASRRKSFGSTVSAPKERDGTNLSRQDSYSSDPFQGYSRASSQAGGLKGGQLIDKKDGQHHQQELMSTDTLIEQKKGHSSVSSRTYQNQDYMSSKETPYDRRRVRNDRTGHTLSDHEQSSINGRPNRYKQNRLSYNEHTRATTSEQVQESPREGIYRQNQQEFNSNSHELGRRKHNDEQQTNLYSDPDRYEAGFDGYSNSSTKQNSHSTIYSYGLSGGTVPRSSGQSSTAYHSSGPQGSYMQTLPPRFNETSVTGPQKGSSTPPRYNDTSAVGPQRGTSTPHRFSETSAVGSQRGHSNSPRYSDTSAVGSQRGPSNSPRYSETSVAGPQRGHSNSPRYGEASVAGPHRVTSTPPVYNDISTVDSQRGATMPSRYNDTAVLSQQRGNFTPPRATTRTNFDQRPTSVRSGTHNYEDLEPPPYLHSAGQSGSSSGPAPNFVSSQQTKVRYTNSSYHPQFGDRQQSQAPYNISGHPPGSIERSACGSGINSNITHESPRQAAYSRPQQPNKFRSDLVTQL